MPSITLYVSASHQISKDSRAAFSVAIADIAMNILKAKDNNIHISYLSAEVDFGTPVYFEARLRQEAFRTQTVLDEFLHRVDLLIREKMGVTARIRCFAFEANHIYAKN